VKILACVAKLRVGVALAAISLAAGTEASAYDLQGSWLSPCFAQGGQHFKRDLYIISSQIYQTQSLFSDGDCLQLSVKLERVLGYQAQSSGLVSGASDVDLTEQQSFMTVYDAGTVELWNRAKFCGISDWDVGVPREVTGKECGGHSLPARGDRDFDLYMRDGYSRLWTGLRTPVLDGSSPDKRPHDLDRTVSFHQSQE
jgi:hypothetical protein